MSELPQAHDSQERSKISFTVPENLAAPMPEILKPIFLDHIYSNAFDMAIGAAITARHKGVQTNQFSRIDGPIGITAGYTPISPFYSWLNFEVSSGPFAVVTHVLRDPYGRRRREDTFITYSEKILLPALPGKFSWPSRFDLKFHVDPPRSVDGEPSVSYRGCLQEGPLNAGLYSGDMLERLGFKISSGDFAKAFEEIAESLKGFRLTDRDIRRW